jgi:hypothetical protein
MYISDEITRDKKMKKLKKYIKKKEIEAIVVSKKIKKNKEFMNYLESINKPIINGRWLFKYLVIQVLEYIAKCQNKEISEQNISLVFKNYTDVIAFYIEYLSKNAKSIKIVTRNRYKLRQIEKKIYSEYGIALSISNNKRKAIRNESIIINFDLDENEINKFRINDCAILVNLKEKIEIKSKRFKGVNINFYEIDFKNKFIDSLEWINEYEKQDIYESYQYKNAHIYDIEEEILKNNIKITNLIGINGIITKKEIKVMTK